MSEPRVSDEELAATTGHVDPDFERYIFDLQDCRAALAAANARADRITGAADAIHDDTASMSAWAETVRQQRDDCRAALAAARDALDEIRSLLHEWTYHYKDRSVVLAHNVAAEAIGRPDRIAEGQKRAGLTAERDAALARAERAEAAMLELWDRTLFGQSEMLDIERLVAEIRARVKP